VEKPLGLTLDEVDEIYQLSLSSDINIVVNFQRHFDDSYNTLELTNSKVLSVTCHYIKGLNHIGITMLDTLIMIFGYPKSVYSYNKIYNNEVNDFTYEFILFYENFNITVKTIDQTEKYNYHFFDIDILTDKGRSVFTDNGNTFINYSLTEYAYSGVKVLNNKPKRKKTQYANSILKCVEYLYDITFNQKIHNKNKVVDSYNNHILLDKIVESYKKEKKIVIEEQLWKK
jgi:predicted dehydrogenase